MSFEDDIRRFSRKTDARVNLAVKKIVFDVATRLVLRSPVGDASYWRSPAPPGYVGGRFRANWQFAINNYDTTTSDNVDAGGGKTLVRIGREVPNDASGKVHFITNSLAYSKALEEGRSRQAPNGMVRLTVLEFEPIIKQVIAELT